jgi:UDP:flavonoid glycosyltransferase YjiC (YdhE family)
MTDLVISHGGSGSVIGALAHGLPTLVLPLGADQTHNGERLTQLGAGLVLDAASVQPSDVADAVHALLGDPAYRHAATAIETEMANQPGPEATVPRLEALSSG